ncbi:hypothetical protein [uncultured Dokdonia sp.]|uniref:hypothetical protein n=1 Tax=uncultured Dokdonia sp. TaxID=575653 RepID=UPI0030EDBC7E|tara:strand:+ start:25397 stop:28429 length:3033 start_codon:yes stop_codon:yes gene_type:complete
MTNFFSILLKKHNLQKHDGRSLWEYSLNDKAFIDLKKCLQFSSPFDIDSRDVALYYALWWKKNYNGGIPSKQEVFSSVGGNTRYNYTEKSFYELAIEGAQILGIKWIKKQNTLRFKTLLLQGGLPLKHISENQGKYKDFLEAVLEEQPSSIEDFMFKSHIVDLLPKSSQNDMVYENCLEIVKSILNNDGEFDKLLESEDTLKEISSSLKVKSASISKKVRQSKPKNYWLLRLDDDKCRVTLRLGLANTYTQETLQDILGFSIAEKEYQFYMDDNLICVFRRMNNNSYKTDWYNQQNREWSISDGFPYTYVICNNKKIEVSDFVQIIPNLEEPSLWSRFNDNEWRLVKGNSIPGNEAAILFPNRWKSDLPSSQVTLYSNSLQWMPFEGEITIQSTELNDERVFLTDVESFDWLIQTQKPNWMLRANLPVVKTVPNVLIFDENGYDISRNRFKVYLRKHKSKEFWDDITTLKYIKTGCYDVKIIKGDLVAYDTFFNIGNLKVRYTEQSIHSASISFQNLDYFTCKLNESILVEIKESRNCYSLKLNTEYSKIPKTIKGSIGNSGKKKLYFDLRSPFQGMIITDDEGQIIPEDQKLSLANLYGMRILSTVDKETVLTIQNSLKTDVKITKIIKESTQPVISFKDEIVRLFYLADAMNYRNTVCLELSEGNNKKTFEISGFSHTLDVTDELIRQVALYDSNDDLDLFAVPVNCNAKDIDIIPLSRNDEKQYLIPSTGISNQFIIISSKKEGNQLMPRFVKTSEQILTVDSKERIENFHKELSITKFKDDIWQQVLSYFKICTHYELPFSTFDQLRAISRSSQVAARAFLFLGINQIDTIEYIQKDIPELEKDLGFCFHWIAVSHWENSINEISQLIGDQYYSSILEIVSNYMGNNGLEILFRIMSYPNQKTEPVLQSHIRDLRSQLGTRVLNELPYNSPKISQDYNIQIEDHNQVRLLIQSPIAVAESINDIQQEFPIWAGNEKRDIIRRNIQYSQYLKPDFYNKTLLHALTRS